MPTAQGFRRELQRVFQRAVLIAVMFDQMVQHRLLGVARAGQHVERFSHLNFAPREGTVVVELDDGILFRFVAEFRQQDLDDVGRAETCSNAVLSAGLIPKLTRRRSETSATARLKPSMCARSMATSRMRSISAGCPSAANATRSYTSKTLRVSRLTVNKSRAVGVVQRDHRAAETQLVSIYSRRLAIASTQR